MLAIKKRFNQWQRKITLVIFAGLILVMSLPTNSVEAAGYYSVKEHKTGIIRPYYTTKERTIAHTEITRPYYATPNRKPRTTTGDNYMERSKRSTEVIPQELGRNKRQKNLRVGEKEIIK
jgi:hypothetical protein